MNTLVALVFTFVIGGEVYQDVPETFYSMGDCQQFKADNNLGGDFTCIIVQAD